jgi:hypothetical protein
MIHPKLLALYDKAFELRTNDPIKFNETLYMIIESNIITPENVIVLNEFIQTNLRSVLLDKNTEIFQSIMIYGYNILNNMDNIQCEEWLKEAVYKDTISIIEYIEKLIDIENGSNDL